MEKIFDKNQITQEIKDSLVSLIHLRLIKEILESKEKEQGNIVLKNNIIFGKRPKISADGNFERDIDKNIIFENYRVLDSYEDTEIYNYSEEEFKKYNYLQTKQLENIGIYTKNPNAGSLVVHALKLKEETNLIKLLEPITGLKNEQIYNLDRRKEYLDLSEKLIISVMNDEDILRLKESLLKTKPFLDFDNKVRIETNFQRNDALKDFSKNIEDLELEQIKNLVCNYEKNDTNLKIG